MSPEDPVPPLPIFRHGQWVIVVDAKRDHELRWVGHKGMISTRRPGAPRVIVEGDHLGIPRVVDCSRSHDPAALIVEPVQ